MPLAHTRQCFMQFILDSFCLENRNNPGGGWHTGPLLTGLALPDHKTSNPGCSGTQFQLKEDLHLTKSCGFGTVQGSENVVSSEWRRPKIYVSHFLDMWSVLSKVIRLQGTLSPCVTNSECCTSCSSQCSCQLLPRFMLTSPLWAAWFPTWCECLLCTRVRRLSSVDSSTCRMLSLASENRVARARDRSYT